MRIPLHLPLLVALGVSALGAGCGESSTPVAREDGRRPGAAADTASAATIADTAAAPQPTALPNDLIASGDVTLGGTAVWDTLAVAEWMNLAAQSDAERRAARAASRAGGDSVRVVRLQPGEDPGTARVHTGVPLGTAFETEVLHRFMGVDERLDLTFSGGASGGGRRMPSVLEVSFLLHRSGLTNEILITLGGSEGTPSEAAHEVLPQTFRPEASAHRFGVRYDADAGRVVVLVDGEAAAAAAARLGGGPMTVTAKANAGPRGRVYLLRWTLDTGS